MSTLRAQVEALSDDLPPHFSAQYRLGHHSAVAAAARLIPEDAVLVTPESLRDALDDAMIVAAILRGDPTTARLANRLDVSLHKALAAVRETS